MKTPTSVPSRSPGPSTRSAPSQAEVRERVEEHLVAAGYALLAPVKVRGRRPDIVALRGERIVMVKVKGGMGDVMSGIARTIDLASGSHRAYLALPAARSSGRLRSVMEALGLGLLEVDGGVRRTVEARGREPLVSVRRRVLGSGGRGTDAGGAAGTATPLRHTTMARISRHRGVVRQLLEHPGRSFTIRELASLSGTPYATAWRFLNELYGAGVVTRERIGPSVVCRLNEGTPFLEEVRKIVAIRTSPHRLAAEAFTDRIKGSKGVERVVLFGSVARGEEGPGSDVDVAVFVHDGRVKRRVDAAADEVLGRTGIRVIPLVLTVGEAIEDGRFREALERGEVLHEGAA